MRESRDLFLSKGARFTGLALMALGFLVNVIALTLLIVYRNTDAVGSNQIECLAVICVGSMMMNGAIFCLSWDDGANWTTTSLSRSCATAPWLFFIGQAMTMHALHQKAHRSSLVYVMGDFSKSLAMSTILTCCTAITLLVWTVLDARIWLRRDLSIIPPITYGECTSSHNVWFLAVLTSIAVFHCVIVGWKSWMSLYSMSPASCHGPILYACYASLQCWSFGVPMIIVVGSSSVDAAYFARLCVAWILGAAAVSTVVWTYLGAAMREGRRSQRFQFQRGSMIMIEASTSQVHLLGGELSPEQDLGSPGWYHGS